MLKYGMRPTRCWLAPAIPSARPSLRRNPTTPAATLVEAKTVEVERRSSPRREDFRTNSTAKRAPLVGASKAAETPWGLGWDRVGVGLAVDQSVAASRVTFC